MSDTPPAGEPAPADTTPPPADPGTEPESPKPVRGDLTGDGLVNQADFDVMSAAWLSKTGEERFNPAADLNGDGVIGLEDFQILESLATGTNG